MPTPASPQPPSPSSKRGPLRLLSVLLAATIMLVSAATGASAVRSSVAAAANPPMATTCEMDLAISLDLSNSVTAIQLDEMRAAVVSLVSQLQGYPIRFAIHNFATAAPATSAQTNAALPLTDLSQAGIAAITSHVNAIARPASQQGGTNWDAAFKAVTASAESYDALLFVTDGNPTQYGAGQGPGNSTDLATIDAAVRSANALKAKGTRIVPIGVSDNLTGANLTAFTEHITQVSGSVVGSDYFISNFAQLAKPLISIANQNCASIELAKDGSLPAGSGRQVGDPVTYTFTATNTGSVPLTNVAISDPKPGLGALTGFVWPGTPGTLLPNQSVTATATYLLTAADLSAGRVDNTATVTGQPPAGDPVRDTDPASVDLTRPPAISVLKEGALAAGATGRAGDLVTYTFTITNDGGTTLTNVTLTDPKPGLSAVTYGTWPGAARTLLPGQSVTASATYRLTQGDVDAGQVDNTATATGTPPVGPPVTGTDDESVPVTPGPVISVVKTGTLAAGATGEVGDLVTYTFTVSNDGNVTLRQVGLTDPLPGLSGITYGIWPGAAGTLLPGQSVSASATYALKRADLLAGRVDNTATAVGTSPKGATVDDTDDETVAVPQRSGIEVVKSGALAAGAAAGDRVDYTFTITNTGYTTLSGVVLADPLPGLSAIAYGTWPGAAGVLAPGQSVTATASYVLKQGDVDNGRVDNTATATGTPPTGDPVSDTDDERVVVPAAPAVDVVKTGALAQGGSGRAGDVVEYGFTITNTGNVTLTGVALRDPLPGLSAIAYGTWPGAAGVLRPNQSVTATASYVLKQGDVDNGRVDNTATATGTPPTGDPVTDTDDERVVVPAAPAIDVVKTGALAQGATGRAGDVVEYGFTITNTGNVTLTGVVLADPLPGLSAIAYGTWPGAAGRLLPGQSVTASAAYVLAQRDVDNGRVDNTATATGTPPTGDPVTGDDSTRVPVAPGPRLTVLKTGALAQGASGRAGDVVEYEFTLTNTGNVTLSGVVLTDPLPGLSAIAYGAWPGAAGVLRPNQSVTATASYVLTQGDVDNGRVDNTATATGTPPTGDPVTGKDSKRVPVPSAPALVVDKTGSLPAGSTGRVGDVVTYSFTLTNTGNVTLTRVSVTDPLPGLSAITYGAWPGAAGVLAPGQSVTASATYVLAQADLDAGGVHNSATGTGTPPTGDPVTDDDVVDVPVRQSPAVEVVKTGALAAGATGRAGDVVEYAFTVTNTGNVTLTRVAVADPKVGLSAITYGAWPGTPGRLAPGESVTARATYVLTQADVNAGTVPNTVTATGTPPVGPPVSDPDQHTLTVPQLAAIDLVKTGALVAGGRAGDLVEYTFVVTNTGNLTLRDVALADPLPGLSAITFGTWPHAAGVLQPGESVRASASYALTQADVDAGTVHNTATATGTPPPPAGQPGTPPSPVRDNDDADVAVKAGPALEIVKSAELTAGAGSVVGDEVRYTFTVTNTGTTTLRGVAVSDQLAGLSAISFGTWPGAPGVLAPGQKVVATATYALTQADVDAGRVVNNASATGTPPTGDPVRDEDEETTRVPGAASVQLVKKGRASGERVRYTFTVTNTGQLTLRDVRLRDEMKGLSRITWGRWPGTAGTLAPGESVRATATYTVRAADVERGHVDNEASVLGVAGQNAVGQGTVGHGGVVSEVSDSDEVRVPVKWAPPTPVLPETGSPVGLPVAFAAGLLALLAGGLLVRRGRTG